MRKASLICATLFLLVACKSKNRVPGNIIPQKKMQVVLWDMMRADQFLNDYVLNRDSTKKKETESLRYYQQIFAIHKISREEFQRSFDFYRSKPELFRSIMDSLSAPPGSVIVTSTDQVTTPLAVPDSTVKTTPVRPTNPDTAFQRRRATPIAN